jgi:hypothetical protein
MATREIIDFLGRSTGERIARYVWRSKPTRSPVSGRQVRCLVAQDEKGRYWDATRIGRGDGQKARHEFWLEPSATKERAMAMSRQQTREYLSAEAELYSNTITDKKRGEQIVKITMDDGWSVTINAPEKPAPPSPAFARVMKLFEEFGSDKKPPQKSRSRGRSKEAPPPPKRGRGIER